MQIPENINSKYKTILADPPWEICQVGNYGASRHYDLMTLDQIKNMPVADLADPDGSHCWLWVTSTTLRHGYIFEIPPNIFFWERTENLLLSFTGK